MISVKEHYCHVFLNVIFGAIHFHYIPEMADISMANISKTQQITAKQSRWMNKTTVTMI